MMNRPAALLLTLALAACSGKNGGENDAAQDADAPPDVHETHDPDVPADGEADPDASEADVHEDVPVDPEDEELACEGLFPVLDDVRITNDSGSSFRPSLAWTGSEFGVSWDDSRDGNTEIYLARISSAGTKVGTDVRITNDSASSEFPTLAWTGSEFGVGWIDERDGNQEVYFARISPAGSKVGTDVRITSDAGISQQPSLAWTDSEYAVSWTDTRDGNTEIYLARISSTGSKIGTDVRITDDSATSFLPSLLWTGSEYGVSWFDARDGNQEVYFARISSTGTKVGTDVRITDDSATSLPNCLAWSGSEFGVGWYDDRDGNDEIYFARISSTGSKVGSDVRITNNPGSSLLPSAAWTGSEYALSWNDSRDGNDEIYLALISSSGSTVGSDVRITNDPASSGAASLVWTDSEFGVIWMDDRDGNHEIYFNLLRYCP